MKLFYLAQIWSVYGGLLSPYENDCVSIFDYKSNGEELNRAGYKILEPVFQRPCVFNNRI